MELPDAPALVLRRERDLSLIYAAGRADIETDSDSDTDGDDDANGGPRTTEIVKGVEEMPQMFRRASELMLRGRKIRSAVIKINEESKSKEVETMSEDEKEKQDAQAAIPQSRSMTRGMDRGTIGGSASRKKAKKGSSTRSAGGGGLLFGAAAPRSSSTVKATTGVGEKQKQQQQQQQLRALLPGEKKAELAVDAAVASSHQKETLRLRGDSNISEAVSTIKMEEKEKDEENTAEKAMGVSQPKRMGKEEDEKEEKKSVSRGSRRDGGVSSRIRKVAEKLNNMGIKPDR
eukprot:jgi/Bigna1/126137/aug1.2_g845